jgi:hypothetical protein
VDALVSRYDEETVEGLRLTGLLKLGMDADLRVTWIPSAFAGRYGKTIFEKPPLINRIKDKLSPVFKI